MEKVIKAAVQNLEHQIEELEKQKTKAIKKHDTEHLPYWDGGIDAYRHAIGLLNSYKPKGR